MDGLVAVLFRNYYYYIFRWVLYVKIMIVNMFIRGKFTQVLDKTMIVRDATLEGARKNFLRY